MGQLLRKLPCLALALSAVPLAFAQNPLFSFDSSVARPKVDLFHLNTDYSTPYRPGFFKNLTIESFGYGAGPQAPGFAFSPGYTSSLYNTHGLECSACMIGPLNRARFTLPPFGAGAVLKLANGRVELFSRAGGIEAFKPEGTFEQKGRQHWSTYYGDAWLVQGEAGGRFSLDRHEHVWLGATGRYLQNFGSGLRSWKTLSGTASFRFGR